VVIDGIQAMKVEQRLRGSDVVEFGEPFDDAWRSRPPIRSSPANSSTRTSSDGCSRWTRGGGSRCRGPGCSRSREAVTHLADERGLLDMASDLADLTIRNTGSVPYEDAPANGAVLIDSDGARSTPSPLSVFGGKAAATISLAPGMRSRDTCRSRRRPAPTPWRSC